MSKGSKQRPYSMAPVGPHWRETHKCDPCGKRFKTETILKAHLLFYTEEKPHKCDPCGRRFKTEIILKVQLFVHTVEKPHKCEFCSKRFKTEAIFKEHLLEHLLVHAGEKPY